MAEDRRITKILNEFDRVAEKAAVLAGERHKGISAVRIVDMMPIMELSRDVETKEVTATPTAEDFNSLLKDIRELKLAVTLIGESLKAKTAS